MKRFLALRAVFVLGAALCVGLLAFAFSTQDETTKVVGTHKLLTQGPVKNPWGGSRQLDQRVYVGRKVVFKYRSWKVFGVDVWTWGGEYWRMDGEEPISQLRLDEAKEEYVFTEDVPSEYRTPRGWLLFGPWVVLAVAAVLLSLLIGRRVGSLPTFRPATTPPGETAEQGARAIRRD